MTFDALELDVFTCELNGVTQIEASAGTGKTWNICALYLRLLLEKNLQVDQILVVTFTKAATTELHARIRSHLMRLEKSLVLGDPFLTDLIRRIVDTKTPEMSIQQALKQIRCALNGFDQAAIYTIHSFCQLALQESPFAAVMPFALEIETDDTALRFDIAAQFWGERVETEAARSTGFAYWLVSHGAGPAVLQELLAQRLRKPLAKIIWTDPVCDTTVDITIDYFKRAANLWRAERKQIEQWLVDSSAQLNQRTHKPTQIQAALMAWEHFFVRGDRWAPISKDALKLTSSSLIAATKTKCKPLIHAFSDYANVLVAALQAEHAIHLRLWFSLVREWLHMGPLIIAQRKRTARIMSFNDLPSNLYYALHARSGLVDALRERYSAALIDEFQDTDPLQFGIFKKIFAPQGPLFLVGDPKQAIYSFRGADLHTYLNARTYANASYTLAVNQRSDATIVAACNRLFSNNSRAFVLDGLDYCHVRAGIRRHPKFLDRRDPISITDRTRAALRVWWLPDHPLLNKRDAQYAAAEVCAAEIARIICDARSGNATIGIRSLTPADIAVLVQTHRQGMLMKQVFRKFNIGSVEFTQTSVFKTIDAEQFEYVLLAIDAPGDLQRLHAALATDWIGLDAMALWAMEQAESAMTEVNQYDSTHLSTNSSAWVEQFSGYQRLWQEHGFAPMWRIALRELNVIAHLASTNDGERRITDINHLTELIQVRDREHPGIAPTLCWLSAKRSDPGIGEDTQLRLASDRDLVQIVTIHKSKGLEYPVVFCPFLNNSVLGARPLYTKFSAAREYYCDDGLSILHFGCDGEEAKRIDYSVMREQAAERARLIYVAITRAIYRCYLVAGIYTSGVHGSTKESRQSILNWIVAGGEMHFDTWLKEPPKAAVLVEYWQALQNEQAASVIIMPLPTIVRHDLLLPPSDISQVPVRTRALKRRLFETWKTVSFSSLAISQQQLLPDIENILHVRPDHDDLTQVNIHTITSESETMLDNSQIGLDADDILRFPRGAAAGNCLHRLMELANLRDPLSWPTAIVRALTERPVNSHTFSDPQLTAMMMRLLRDIANTQLESDFMLGEMDPSRRLTELEFVFPITSLDMHRFSIMLREYGIVSETLDHGMLHGYLRGFIDAVIEFQGQFWIIDWKSNYLGNIANSYRTQMLSSLMDAHAYRLQALIYTIALHRYLRARLIDYDYEIHFGASLYLFLRGVRPNWPGSGIARFRPSFAAIKAFDALFTTKPKNA
ncbi:exodeoxyribonuclease V subunit beta [Candidatus Vallotia lariciata]|uniref:exodeoxyribonuclease V subunit beta n=1 Tax=Candidatus Vallotia laricis TaxID=2018052 RepID=UPI001D00A22B|nr:exodeoxyribonuclease V subunit beta [Candidatus Vallotia lariciata]UDG82654.1 exodeoxyribonuclease V subunit beta [Candidatus Vallotia lariciata]